MKKLFKLMEPLKGRNQLTLLWKLQLQSRHLLQQLKCPQILCQVNQKLQLHQLIKSQQMQMNFLLVFMPTLRNLKLLQDSIRLRKLLKKETLKYQESLILSTKMEKQTQQARLPNNSTLKTHL
jgi:hypothetical protein